MQKRNAAVMGISIILVMLFVSAGLIRSVDGRAFLSKKSVDNNDVYEVFKEFGYDDAKLEYYRRQSRFMQEDRVAPGGPAAQHHK